jgi:hypothetical protein
MNDIISMIAIYITTHEIDAVCVEVSLILLRADRAKPQDESQPDSHEYLPVYLDLHDTKYLLI